MDSFDEQDIRLGSLNGSLAEPYQDSAWRKLLASPRALLRCEGAEELGSGRHRIVRAPVRAGGLDQVWLVKSFARENPVKNRIDARRGSKARRTWLAACHLRQNKVGTPAPIAFLERWQGAVLRESYFISEYEPAMSSLRDELIRLYRHNPHCDLFLVLLQRVAESVRVMHESGFLHNDLGNQNILLRRKGESDWGDIQFIDLNRGRISQELTPRERGRDVTHLAAI